MKRYPEYKESEFQWIGQIPAHWETKPVWMMFRLGRGRVISNEEIGDNPGSIPFIRHRQRTTESWAILIPMTSTVTILRGQLTALKQEPCSTEQENSTVPTFVERFHRAAKM